MRIRKRRTTPLFPRFLLLVLCVITTANVPAVVAQEELCTVCADGEPIALPEKEIPIDGFADCRTLNTLAAGLQADHLLCSTVRKFGTYCGCNIPEGACHLCSSGISVQNPNVYLEDYPAKDFLGAAAGNVNLTCGLLEAESHARSNKSFTCIQRQWDTYERCGCPLPDSIGPPIIGPGGNYTYDVDDDDTVAPGLEMPENPCTICVDGGEMAWPDKKVEFGPDSVVHSCADFQTFAAFYNADEKLCQGVQAISTYCGCSYQRNQCSFCANGEKTPVPDRHLPWLKDVIKRVPEEYKFLQQFLTCGYYEALVENVKDDTLGVEADLVCLAGQFKSGRCGCTHDWRPILLVWAYRISGICSLIGSAYILYDILSNSRKRRTTYHQLILGISTYDCISSFAYALATVMVPEDSGLYQAVGNNATCMMQGAMIQLGISSVYYNALLSVYFLLMVKYNWKEEQFKRFHGRVHLPINLIGLGMAFGAIPFYFPQFAVCYIVQPPVADTWFSLAFFYTLPVSLALSTLVACTLIICHKVFNQERQAMKWTYRKNWNLSKRVFWQSFWYVLSFMVTLPLLIVSYFLKFRTYDSYYLFLVAAFLAPLQGTLNAFVYFQRDNRLWCCKGLCGFFSCKRWFSFMDFRASGSTAQMTASNMTPVKPNVSSSRISQQAKVKFSKHSRLSMSQRAEVSLTLDEIIAENENENASADGMSDDGDDEYGGIIEFLNLLEQASDESLERVDRDENGDHSTGSSGRRDSYFGAGIMKRMLHNVLTSSELEINREALDVVRENEEEEPYAHSNNVAEASMVSESSGRRRGRFGF